MGVMDKWTGMGMGLEVTMDEDLEKEVGMKRVRGVWRWRDEDGYGMGIHARGSLLNHFFIWAIISLSCFDSLAQSHRWGPEWSYHHASTLVMGSSTWVWGATARVGYEIINGCKGIIETPTANSPMWSSFLYILASRDWKLGYGHKRATPQDPKRKVSFPTLQKKAASGEPTLSLFLTNYTGTTVFNAFLLLLMGVLNIWTKATWTRSSPMLPGWTTTSWQPRHSLPGFSLLDEDAPTKAHHRQTPKTEKYRARTINKKKTRMNEPKGHKAKPHFMSYPRACKWVEGP